jgi:hypothetical protein
MHLRVVRRPFIVSLVFVSVLAFAAKEFIMPQVYPAKTYPARDEHPMEKVTIAADPYDLADKAAIFNQKYLEHGYMPIFVVVTNDSDKAIVLNDLKVELITVRKAKISAATEDDLYRRLSHLARRGDEPSRNPLPIPLPKHPKAGVSEKGRDEIDRAMFSAKAVAPHESEAGFFFFDVGDISNPLAGAHLYLSGIESDGQELMYFEIPMEKYLSYIPPGSTTPH